MEDEDFTVDYDYSNMTPVSPCDKNEVHEFAASFLPRFYYVIFSLSLLGNGLVLFVVIKFERLRTVTNIFLLNLVGSNLIFTFGLPFWAKYHQDEWTFGLTLCKLVGTATYVSIYSSVLFLTLLTIDRYLAVVHALAVSQHRKSCYAVVASGCVWLICGLAGVGPLLRYNVKWHWEAKTLCTEERDPSWNALDTYLHFAAFFLLPLVVVVYCYVRIIVTVLSTQINNKHRTLRIVFVILLLFFTCWTPYNIVQLVDLQMSLDCNDSIDYAKYVTHNIAVLYFCINPVFYTFLGRKFQNYARTLIVGYAPCLKNHLSVAANSRSLSNRSPPSL
ncbi:C-C chemokine receptor type 3 [Clupea harengus]|uniref:C-C chemokine receptor type 3 n=1 Tax=Clupea harengus TaxID=7950 RepID=A0A6P3W3M5_CLUHA|nr:C-C chemokine receptor type 3-like [Clupea harengus]XP_042566189.1 C-C chemokine receptor type 3 [Clupea harengus]